GRRLANPQGITVGLDVVVGAAGLDAGRVVFGVPARLRGRAALVDEEPLLALVVLEGACAGVVGGPPSAPGADNREPTLELFPLEVELQLAVGDRRPGVDGRRLRLPGAPVPDDD